MNKSKRILKYTFKFSKDPQTLPMSKASDIINFEFQKGNGTPALLALCNDGPQIGVRKFCLFGTGDEIPSQYKYHATANAGSQVWHLFEELL